MKELGSVEYLKKEIKVWNFRKINLGTCELEIV